MNVIDYLKKYGRYSFKEKPFNEVDNLVLSLLSYTNFLGVVSNNTRNKIRLEDAANKYLDKNGTKVDDVLPIREAIEVLVVSKDTKRFRDILLYNYKYIYSDDSQFSVITFELSKKLVYVSFEGTDKLISGWIEDCKMAYEFPVTAHEYAINYLNKYFSFSTKKIIVGGHSKGGNLALVSALGCKKSIYRRIINIYSNDGQGLRKEETYLERYDDLEKKYVHICPYNSIIGLLLEHSAYYISVDSDRPIGISHSGMSWQIEDDHFKTREVSRFSKLLDEGFNRWLSKYDYDTISRFVSSVGKVLEENNIVTVLDFVKNKKLIIDVLKSTRNMDSLVKDMALDLVKVLYTLNIEDKFL
jgi:hypothetical protein